MRFCAGSSNASYFASASLPNSAGIGNFGMMGFESSSYDSTFSAISSVCARNSGFSGKSADISSAVLNHSCPV